MHGKKNIDSLTGLRGLAALEVMLYHSNPPDIGSKFVHNFFYHGYLAVDLFFLLSGFIMVYNYEDLFKYISVFKAQKKFLIYRAARIYPVYIIVSSASLFIFVILNMRGFESQLLTKPLVVAEIANVLMIQSWGLAGSFNGAAWSISTEWAAYIIFPLLLWLSDFSRVKVSLIFIFIVIFTLLILTVFPDLSIWHDQQGRNGPLDRVDHTSAAPLIRCIAEFSIGMISCRIFYRLNNLWKRILKISALPLIIIGGILFVFSHADLIIVFLMSLMIVSIALENNFLSYIINVRPIFKLGELSYSFYMLHVFVVDLAPIIDEFLIRFTILPVFTTRFVISIFITYVMAHYNYIFIEKPFRKLIRKIEI